MNVDTNRTEDPARRASGLVSTLSAFRDTVIDQWRSRVTAEIPTASGLGEPLLLNMLPTLYDNIAEALAGDPARLLATSDTDLATAHGRERANMTNYTPHDLIRELQIFREVLFSVSKENGVALDQHAAQVIGESIEKAARDSISGFSEASKELNESFITSLSHDLRNPLHVASASAQLIRLKTADPGIDKLAERILRKLGEADAMIQTLLDAAVLQGRMKLKLQITAFDIMSLVEEVCADIPMLGQRVTVAGEKIVGHWCRPSLKRVLENLLSNAQKYGNAAETITVALRREDDLLLMSVHNEGTPIPRIEMERLFKTYQRIEDTHIKGWGLGLPYVRNVAESHGGTVVVDSAEGRGTTFTISLPVDARPYARD